MTFRFIVTVETDSEEHAGQVMDNRISLWDDSDYELGFDYEIEWEPADE